ncbi:MAG TPA: quinone oxidoreductase [Gemmatimonadales bacterium]
MKAIRVEQPGGAEVLRLEDVPIPTPGPGQALIKVEAAGVNFIDIYRRSGAYPVTYPITPGSEAGGTVEAVGTGVTVVRPGDRVASSDMIGAYAEYALAPADRLVPLPERVSARDGAAAILQGITAHYLTASTHRLKRGDTCLVHAAAGGVGLLICQMARQRGARVIGTVSTEEKATLAREAGATDVILYTEVDFEVETKRLTDGAGVEVVYDSVGRTTFAKSLNCLARRGVMVLFGQSSGPVEPFDPQVLNRKGSLFLTRPTIGHYTATRRELLQRASAVLHGIADGNLSVRIGGEFPLAQASEAHRRLESRRTTGKLLLLP